MEKLIVPMLAATLLFASCGGNACGDLETAEGVAKCMCEKSGEYEKAKEANDEDAIKALKDERKEIMEKVEKNMEDGKYSENDVEAAAAKIDGCDL